MAESIILSDFSIFFVCVGLKDGGTTRKAKQGKARHDDQEMLSDTNVFRNKTTLIVHSTRFINTWHANVDVVLVHFTS
jgi:hypothetical protein